MGCLFWSLFVAGFFRLIRPLLAGAKDGAWSSVGQLAPGLDHGPLADANRYHKSVWGPEWALIRNQMMGCVTWAFGLAQQRRISTMLEEEVL